MNNLDLAKAFVMGILVATFILSPGAPKMSMAILLAFTVLPVMLWDFVEDRKQEKNRPYDYEKEEW
ncbi:hypothetical protein EBZ39_16435 [bacterium]|nr:hypothetical protein [bacterium]